MKLNYLFVAILFVCSCTAQQDASLSVDVTDDIVKPKHYIIPKAQNPILIDGLANEPEWQQIAFTDEFIDIEGIKTPKYSTKAKMLWDDDYLYIFSILKDPHIWGDIKDRDAIIYLNNDFEVFIDPSQTGFGYGEIEINALNTVWDLYLDKPYRVGGKPNFEWNLDQLKTAINIEGSLNEPNDIDNYWSIEIAIPLKPLISLKNKPSRKPVEGEQWNLNFSRVQWDHDIIDGIYKRKKIDNKIAKEYNWVWSNQKVINMHEPEKWGIIQFTESNTTEDIKFINDTDIMIKQVAFALFRRTKFKDLKYLQELDINSKKELTVIYSKIEQLKATFYKTNFGFEYLISNPENGHYYMINEQGQIRLK